MASSSKIPLPAVDAIPKQPPRAQERILVPQSALDHIFKISPSVEALFNREMNDAAFRVLANFDINDLLLLHEPRFTPTIFVAISKEPSKSLQDGLKRLCKPFDLSIFVSPRVSTETSVEDETSTEGEKAVPASIAADNEDEDDVPTFSEDPSGGGRLYTSNIRINPESYLSQELKVDQETKIKWKGSKTVDVSIDDFNISTSPGPYQLEAAKFALYAGAEGARMCPIVHVPSGWTNRVYRKYETHQCGQNWTFPVTSDDDPSRGGKFRLTTRRTIRNAETVRAGPCMEFEYTREPIPTKTAARTVCVWSMTVFEDFSIETTPCHGYLRFVQIVDQELPRWLSADRAVVAKSSGDLPTVMMDGMLFDFDAAVELPSAASSALATQLHKDDAHLESNTSTCIDIPRSFSGVVPKKQGVLQKLISILQWGTSQSDEWSTKII
ncbi:hypothetical protein Hypma_016244 [Hypsizygus marmoreus]|uniref:Uncharacterized protein n=1 Tax=Hypsizygus marmoreus TaxID=39966 RepID=A0A369J027_HYPMA|nr:hypothetical protein Hypma_016244 [Hypsizygus marmoreus]